MNISRYEPRYRPLSLFDRLLNQDLDGLLNPQLGREAEVVTDWLPAVDIRETDNSYVLHADLPGVLAADIEVSMEDGVLTIQGKRESESQDEQEGFKRFERVTGKFMRRFTLPDTANGEQISASTREGVLEVTIPKQDKLKPRKIDVVTG